MNLPINDQQKMNEIIFANRNKKYGAYVLRSSYNATLFRALFIIISSVLIFALSVRIFTNRHNAPPINIDQIVPEMTKTVTVSMEPLDQPRPQPRTQRSTLPASNQNSQSNVVVDSLPDPNQVTPLNNQLASNTGSATANGPEVPGGTGTGAGVTTTTFTIRKDIPTVAVADVSPEFEGGYASLRNFISSKIAYPTLAREVGIQGNVYVTFVVDEKGEVGSVKVLRGIGGGCDEEAARVVGLIPKFKNGGSVKGEPVKVIFNIPIAFKLN